MKFEKLTTHACCGSINIIYVLEKPTDHLLIDQLASNSFTELKHFTQSGMLYLENDKCIITSPLGQNKITIKFKTKEVDLTCLFLENILRNL